MLLEVAPEELTKEEGLELNRITELKKSRRQGTAEKQEGDPQEHSQ